MKQTLCPECGLSVPIDEDGCCITCGATSVGKGADEVIARIHELERRVIQLETRFIHYHENNKIDDACAKCGLDLRDSVHVMRRWGEEP